MDVFFDVLVKLAILDDFFDDIGRFLGHQHVISSLDFLAFQLSLAARIQRSAERAYFKKTWKAQHQSVFLQGERFSYNLQLHENINANR